MLLRHVLSEGGVATACSCRDLFSLKLTSRHSSPCSCCHDSLVLSRPLLCTIVVATAHDAVLMSRPHPYVATLCLLFLQLLVV